MPAKRYVAALTADERGRWDALTRVGKRSARAITRARVLLSVDQGDSGPGWEDRRAAEALGCGHRTVERVRERFVTDGLDAALTHKPQDRPSRTPVLDGKAEAKLIALACSVTPDGRKGWTLRMLADRLVELEVVEAVSRETVRRALKKKKTRWSRTSSSSGARRAGRAASSWPGWRTCSTCTTGHTTRSGR